MRPNHSIGGCQAGCVVLSLVMSNLRNLGVVMLRPFLVLFLLFVQAEVHGQTEVRTVESAATCKRPLSCPHFSALHDGDAKFRGALKKAMESSKFKPPKWFGKGAESPTIPVALGGHMYLLASTCEPNNCPFQISVLYDLQGKRAVGTYFTEGPEWFGDPTDVEKRALLDSIQGEQSVLYRALRDANSRLPVVVE